MTTNNQTVFVNIPYVGARAAQLIERYLDGDVRVIFEGRQYVAREIQPETPIVEA